MQPYGKDVAEKIIECRKDDFTFKDSGAFPKDDRPSSESEFDACTWRPACELSGQAGQKLREKPALPIPFNENELAAFFLHGWGWYVRDSFGAWDEGPNESAFDTIDHLARGEVKDAVAGAFQAYRAAECVVGQFDNTLACEAQQLDSAFWKTAASLRTAEMRETLHIAHKKANDAEAAWRKKMVNQLLAVAQVPEALPMVTTTQAESTPAPEVAASVSPENSTARLERGCILKKAALIKKHKGQWASINGDFQGASENGLSKAAKATEHGNWFEADALSWARQRGKLDDATEQPAPPSATHFGGLTHRIKG